jgi:hypothetical protein
MLRLFVEGKLTSCTVGPRHRWYFRLCSPGRETFHYAELCPYLHGVDLDKVVPDYQAQELSVRLLAGTCRPSFLISLPLWKPRLRFPLR